MSQLQFSTESQSLNNLQSDVGPIIIGIDCWPALITSYNFVIADEKPALQLTFSLDYQLYNQLDDQARIKKQIQDLAIYKQVKAQFELKNSAEESTRLLTYSISYSLSPTDIIVLSTEQISACEVFVNEVVNKLERSINEVEITNEPEVSLIFPVQLNNKENVFQLSIHFNISNLMYDKSKRFGNASGTVNPLTTNEVLSESFVNSFEQIFSTEQTTVKVAVNEDDKTQIEPWVIRLASENDADGISYSVTATPVAPLPFSTELVGIETVIYPYHDGRLNINGGTHTKFSAIDINVWMSQFVETFDKIQDSLSDDIKSKLNMSDNQAIAGRLAAAKNYITDTLTSTYISTIYSNSADTASTFANARHLLQAALSNYYSSTLVQYSVDTKSQGVGPECFINGTIALTEQIAGIEASEIALDGMFPALAIVDPAPKLKNYLPVKADFTPTHLVVNGPDHSKKSLKIQKNPGKIGVLSNVPVLNYYYPEPPRFSDFETAKSTAGAGTNLEDARKARFRFKLQREIIAQDEIAFKLQFNTEPGQPSSKPATANPVLAALAQFVNTNISLLPDLEAYLDLEVSKQTADAFAKFAICLDTFIGLSLKVAGALTEQDVNEPDETTLIDKGDFSISVRPAKSVADKRLVIDITTASADNAIKVSIDGFETLEYNEENKPKESNLASFIFISGESALTVNHVGELLINVEVDALDVMETDSLSLLDSVIRNNQPLPKIGGAPAAISKAFAIETPYMPVTTVKPENTWPASDIDISLLNIGEGTPGAKAYISAVFKSLLQGSTAIDHDVTIDVSFKTLVNNDPLFPMWTTIPVVEVPNTAFNLQEVSTLAGNISDVLKEHKQTTGTANGRYTFDITVLSAASKRNLLKIEQLYLPADKI